MAYALPKVDLDQLTVPQRLDLITQIWDSIPETIESLPMPEWHRQELDRRLAAADAAPEASVPWEQARERLRGQS